MKHPAPFPRNVHFREQIIALLVGCVVVCAVLSGIVFGAGWIERNW